MDLCETMASCDAAPDWRRIVWLASYPKSGNTWLRLLLANLLSRSRRAFPLNVLPFGHAVDSFRFGELTGVAAEDCTQDEVDRLIPAALRIHLAESATHPEERLCKVHGAYVANQAGEPLFPQDVTAGAIYIVRNPLDVAVSWAFHAEEGTAQSIARLNDTCATLGGGGLPLYKQRVHDWSGHVRSWCDAPFPVLVVRYEDLLQDAARELRRVVRFLGLQSVAEGQLRDAVARSAFASLRRREARAGFVEKPPTNAGRFFREGKAGGWRTALSAANVCRIVDSHAPTMATFGYDAAGAMEATVGSRTAKGACRRP